MKQKFFPHMAPTWLTLALLLTLVPGATPAFSQAPTIPDHGVVLMYHHFGENRYPATNVRLDAFDSQLSHLEENGYKIWPLTRLVTHLKTGTPIPDRVVSITVDDAYLSVYTEAYPRLKARGWPFTVFVATENVDRGYKAFMTWEHMREMAQHGVTFANHGTAHDHLTQHQPGEDNPAWEIRIKKGINNAQQRLKAELGQAPMLFAYPYGEYNLALAGMMKELGYTAFGQHSGAVGRHSDPTAMPRFPVSEHHATGTNFHTKVASLPLPVTGVEPTAVTLKKVGNPPTLKLTVLPDEARISRLNCFASDQGEVPVTWINRQKQRISVVAPAPLTGPRSRYNCTAPSPFPGRFYWYSHPWFR
jgi:peptidoglycan/xylan/chitin deacetylase (PgdA/CDA1 family)